MNFQMRIAEAVQRGRQHAEQLMTDTVQVWRPVGTDEVDEWGRVTGVPPRLVYEGPGKFQNDAGYPAFADVGDTARVPSQVMQVHLPHGTTAVETGDVVECVASQNPRVVGRRVRVRADTDKTWTTAVRLNVVEVLHAGGA